MNSTIRRRLAAPAIAIAAAFAFTACASDAGAAEAPVAPVEPIAVTQPEPTPEPEETEEPEIIEEDEVEVEAEEPEAEEPEAPAEETPSAVVLGTGEGTLSNPFAIGETFIAYDADEEPWYVTVDAINLDAAQAIVDANRGIDTVEELDEAFGWAPGRNRLIVTTLTIQYAGTSTDGVSAPSAGITNMYNGSVRSSTAIVNTGGDTLGSAAHRVAEGERGLHGAGNAPFTGDHVLAFDADMIDGANLRVSLSWRNDGVYIALP